ncbi:MAG: hypothetical protein HKO56_02505, partial [Bacteroidia bacterium]|nr:hypothetical protein [Bacteroidia bacterium]
MDLFKSIAISVCKYILMSLFVVCIINPVNAQQQNISDYLLFSGNGGNGATTPANPGFAVQI